VNLQPIAFNVPGLRLQCCKCRAMHDVAKMVADLEGEPFKAYYCPTCKPKN